MARHATIDDPELLQRLSGVFRDVGYNGASLAALSEATGLKKASLYHRFPDGKEQMAREVLASAERWLTEHVLTPLTTSAPPEKRIRGMIGKLNEFYSGGRQSCLLNMLSSAQIRQGPFTKFIKKTFKAWIETLAVVLVDAGFDADTARMRSERAVALLQGSLVLSRGMGTTKPFRDFLTRLPEELLG
jgi:AcrR family transcriptional regulator